jgi:hypothetical protein
VLGIAPYYGTLCLFRNSVLALKLNLAFLLGLWTQSSLLCFMRNTKDPGLQKKNPMDRSALPLPLLIAHSLLCPPLQSLSLHLTPFPFSPHSAHLLPFLPFPVAFKIVASMIWRSKEEEVTKTKQTKLLIDIQTDFNASKCFALPLPMHRAPIQQRCVQLHTSVLNASLCPMSHSPVPHERPVMHRSDSSMEREGSTLPILLSSRAAAALALCWWLAMAAAMVQLPPSQLA